MSVAWLFWGTLAFSGLVVLLIDRRSLSEDNRDAERWQRERFLSTIPIGAAVLCVDCDMVYDSRNDFCPKCASRQHLVLALTPMRERVA